MCKMNLKVFQNVDYIYSLNYSDIFAAYGRNVYGDNRQALDVTKSTVKCNLGLIQRSSQETLDLADYLKMHSRLSPIRKYASKSFSTKIIPLWIEIADPNSFVGYLQGKSNEWSDVMLMWDNWNKPSNLAEIEKYCSDQKWRCTENDNVKGSEASVTILYDFDRFDYEHLTRAKTQLVIVTIQGKKRYFLEIKSSSIVA